MWCKVMILKKKMSFTKGFFAYLKQDLLQKANRSYTFAAIGREPLNVYTRMVFNMFDTGLEHIVTSAMYMLQLLNHQKNVSILALIWKALNPELTIDLSGVPLG